MMANIETDLKKTVIPLTYGFSWLEEVILYSKITKISDVEDSFENDEVIFLHNSFSIIQVIGINKEKPTILVLWKTKSHFTSGSFSYASLHGPMTNPPPSTMASSVDADPSRASSQARTSTADLPTQQATKNFVMRDFDLTIRAYFPPYGVYEIQPHLRDDHALPDDT